jgi:hypothetical protein
MKFSAILLFVGVAIIGYAYSLAPYSNEALFTERYMALSDGQSTEYWKLRDEMLTPKFQLQDYGGTFVTLAAIIFIVLRKGWRQLKSPISRTMLFGAALATPLLTVGAYVFDLLQGFARGEYPHWADSMSIPLMGTTPALLIVLLLWSGAHLAFLRSNYQSVPLALALSRKSNWWLLSIAAITLLLVGLCCLAGQYWYAIPGVFWLYFYLSLAASRYASLTTEPIAPEKRAARA